MINTMAPPALPCATFVTIALGLAGILHVAWLHSHWSDFFAHPIDNGRTWRGKRIFGKNKTWRGLIAMPFSCAILFALAAQFREFLPVWLAAGIWERPASELAFVGLWAGLVFMLSELPNSFIKRQLNIAPGMGASSPVLRMFFLFIDRIDSTLGVLIVLTLLLPMQLFTWVWALLLGIGLHWFFSYWLYLLKIKNRPS